MLNDERSKIRPAYYDVLRAFIVQRPDISFARDRLHATLACSISEIYNGSADDSGASSFRYCLAHRIEGMSLNGFTGRNSFSAL